MVINDSRAKCRHVSGKAVAKFGIANWEKYNVQLAELPWKAVRSMGGKQTRKSCWFTSKPCVCEYKYGRTKWTPIVMPEWMHEIGELVYKAVDLECNFNSCNANFYEGPEEDLYWHADNESLFRKSECERSVNIVSVSFGSSRVFGIQPNYSHDIKKIILDDGDVMSMEDLFQDKFQHAILPGEVEPFQAGSSSSTAGLPINQRFNLTFRCVQNHSKPCPCRC
jgi:alkylated DNA repair dioxygenase AlkB